MALAALALGGVFVAFIAIGAVALIVMAIYSFWKLRSDEFWEEQD